MLRHGRLDDGLAAPSQGERGGFVTRLTSLGNRQVPDLRRVIGCALPGKIFARGAREEEAPRELEPARAGLHLAKEIVGDRNGRLHSDSLTSHTMSAQPEEPPRTVGDLRTT